MPGKELLISPVVADNSQLQPHLEHAKLGALFYFTHAMLHVAQDDSLCFVVLISLLWTEF